MKKNHLLFILPVLVWLGCDSLDESVSTDTTLQLIFSTDTISFDTLLSENRSSTMRLKVLNPNKSAINISSIFLMGGDGSDYSLIINGKNTNSVSNEMISGGDSILILAEVNVTERDQNLPYLVNDEIVFEWNGNTQDVKLVSYGQDGIRLSNTVLCNTVWSNDRPYIVSDTLLVDEGCELTIERGAKIYFENDAALFIQGTLTAIGDSSERITFTNTRFDSGFDEVPGQWNGIYFLEGSSGNHMAYVDIFNGQVGLRIGTPDDDSDPDVIIENSRIYNMSFAGILAFTSDLRAVNCLVYYCGRYLIGGFAGGNYEFIHCTASSVIFDNVPFLSDEPFVQFSDNIILGDGQLLAEDLQVTLTNNIIWGSGEDELLFNDGGGANVDLSINSNIVYSSEEIENNFSSTEGNFPGLTATFELDTLSFAKDRGVPAGILIDILGQNRDANPDIGAFERIEN